MIKKPCAPIEALQESNTIPIFDLEVGKLLDDKSEISDIQAELDRSPTESPESHKRPVNRPITIMLKHLTHVIRIEYQPEIGTWSILKPDGNSCGTTQETKQIRSGLCPNF